MLLDSSYLQHQCSYCNAHLVEIIIQSKLDYWSQLWCPLQTGDIEDIDMVRKTLLRKFSGLK